MIQDLNVSETRARHREQPHGPTIDIKALTNGQSRVIQTGDGTQMCPALLLTRHMVETVSDVSRCQIAHEKNERSLQRARAEALKYNQRLHGFETQPSRASGQQHPHDLQKAKEDAERYSISLRERCDRLETDLEFSAMALEVSRISSQTMLENVLANAGLLDLTSPVEEPFYSSQLQPTEGDDALDRKECFPPTYNPDDLVEASNAVEINKEETSQEPNHTETAIQQEDESPSEILDELQGRTLHLREIEDLFDARQELYERDLKEYRQAVAVGHDPGGQTEFDLGFLQYEQRLTRGIIEAEEALSGLRGRAKALGVTPPGADGFYDDSFGGAWPEEGGPEDRVSATAHIADPQQMHRIEDWRGAIDIGSIHGDCESDVELDDWDTRSVGISEAGSMIASWPERRRIDDWRKACGVEGRH